MSTHTELQIATSNFYAAQRAFNKFLTRPEGVCFNQWYPIFSAQSAERQAARERMWEADRALNNATINQW